MGSMRDEYVDTRRETRRRTYGSRSDGVFRGRG